MNAEERIAIPSPTVADRSWHRHRRVLAPLMAALLLTACASQREESVSTHTGSTTAPLTQQDYQQAADAWGQRYDQDPKNKDNELNFAAALVRTGRADQAVAVLQKAAIHHPTDREVLAAYGKAMASAGRLQEALQIIRRAQTPDRPDWRLLSAEAAILDQLGDSAGARKLYAQAVALAPNEPSILSNYGMSYVLTGELKEAEKLLRRAVALPGADSRVRQNLALAVGLQGRFSEAEKIASSDLSPEQAAANVAYLRQMLAKRLGSKPGTVSNGKG